VIKGAVQDCLAYVAQQMRQAKFLRMIDREQRVQGGDGTLCVHQLRLCRRRQIFFVPSGGSFFNLQVANFGHQITMVVSWLTLGLVVALKPRKQAGTGC
jgi:hypothetical protein